MTRPSHATEKALFALSGNRCAYSDCPQRLTHRPGPCTTTTVVGEVCHIHGRKPGSPRWNPELTEEQIHDSSNLILLCPTHHTIVDDHPETYTADVLRRWKNDHESKFTAEKIEDFARETRLDAPGRFPTSLVDREIEEALHLIRKGRPFQDFDTSSRCLQLGTALTSGEYAGGTATVRARALAWCARLLTRSDEVNTAKGYLDQARGLGAQEEVAIATALLRSHEGDRSAAFRTLASLDSPMARSAALVVAADQDGPAGALRWASKAGVETAALDPDGKLVLLAWLLELGDWDSAFSAVDAVAAEDRASAPALSRLTALAHLLQAVPAELRATVAQDVPFFAKDFPLGADRKALRARSRARRHIRDAAKAARGLGCSMTAETCEEYALWLELLDAGHRDEARVELQMKLQDLATNLRFVRLGLQFGVPLDIAGVEREIRREVARKGAGTVGTAIARLAIALKQGTAEAVADYIARHRRELADHVDDRMLRSLEIDALARAGRLDEARSSLTRLVRRGLDAPEEDRLRDVIARAEGSDTTASARRRFEESESLADLEDLVDELAAQDARIELCKYSRLLFQETRSREHAERVASALIRAQDYPGLAGFLEANPEQVEQSESLQLSSCWSLFWQGALLEARDALDNFRGDQNQSGYRDLRVQLAVFLGDWESLSTIIESEYQAREDRDWQDLAGAARLAVGLGLPRAKELAFAAAEKAEDNAGALAGIHLLAVRAGWDNEPLVGTWLNRAVALSDTDGPFKKISLPTLVSERPEVA